LLIDFQLKICLEKARGRGLWAFHTSSQCLTRIQELHKGMCFRSSTSAQ
jgi:hypothetical protein